jgi:uncharacterized SAM-binding protein YcdF (DUF218 family)
MDPIILLKFLGHLALPPASLALGLVVAGLLGLLRFRRLARVVAVLTLIENILLTLPAVSDLLIDPLEQDARQAAAKAKPCCYEAIVVLGGGIRPSVPPWLPDPDLQSSADRMWMGAQLYRRGVAPKVIVSGGNVLGDYGGVPANTEAAAMKRFLTDLGVPEEAIVSESRSVNTRDNIAFVRALVQDRPVALVTSAYHMPRALRLARRGRLNAAAFPADWHSPWQARAYWDNWLPTNDAQLVSAMALWEYLALAFDYRSVR